MKLTVGKIRALPVFVILAALISLPGAIAHSAVTYEFTGVAPVFDVWNWEPSELTPDPPFIGTLNAAFTYIAPGFITSDTNVLAAGLAYSSVTSPPGFSFNDISIVPDDGYGQSNVILGLNTPYGGINYYYYFDLGILLTPGTFDSVLLGPEQSGQLRITDSAAAPVPEPSTMLLLGSGLMGLMGYGGRRMKK